MNHDPFTRGLLHDLFGDDGHSEYSLHKGLDASTGALNDFFAKLELETELRQRGSEPMTKTQRHEFIHGLDSYSLNESDARELDRLRYEDVRKRHVQTWEELAETLRAERDEIHKRDGLTCTEAITGLAVIGKVLTKMADRLNATRI